VAKGEDSLDALDRIMRIQCASPKLDWQSEDFRQAALRARKLWRQTEEVLEIQYGLLTDPVAVVEPDFALLESDVQAVSAADIAKMIGGRKVATYFLKWDRCLTTCEIDNPFEPLVEIFEHGGGVSREHGQFIDIYDQRGIAVARLTVSNA
jgi:hypothetical protein